MYMSKQPRTAWEATMGTDNMTRDMHSPTTETALAKTCRFQGGGWMPVSEWIIATRWAWNYERGAMGYAAYLYRFTTNARGKDAPITYQLASTDNLEKLTTQAEAGAWAMGMILAH